MLKRLKEIADDLMDSYNLSDFEALQIAVEFQKNELFKEAFVINEKSPAALEAIALALGYKQEGSNNVSDAIHRIADALDNQK